MDLELVGDADWEGRVLGADGAVLVEFWSPSCAVCRTMEPRLQRVAEVAMQIQAKAGDHQIDGVRTGLAHAMGGMDQFNGIMILGDSM